MTDEEHILDGYTFDELLNRLKTRRESLELLFKNMEEDLTEYRSNPTGEKIYLLNSFVRQLKKLEQTEFI